MKRIIWPAALCALLAAAPAAEEKPLSAEALAAMERISGRAAHAHVRFLASEWLEGREAGERGERIAAEYIADWYLRLGLKPAGDGGTFYQTFRLRSSELTDGNALEVTRQAGSARVTRSFALQTEYLPFTFSPSADVTAPVVFAGYGITAPDLKYDDYSGIDARGKAVLVLRHEPQETDPNSPFKGLDKTAHAAFMTKARNALAHGAVALLVVTDPLNHQEASQRRVGDASLTGWASLAKRDENDRRPPAAPGTEMEGWNDAVAIPAAHVDPAVAEALLGALSLETLQKEIDGALSPRSKELPDVSVHLRTAIKETFKPSRNVVAILEGSDPALRLEHVIIGGHYDHVGWGHSGSLTGHWDRIHPGADDNASGTAGLLTIAEGFAALRTPPPRSVLFVHFSAEEKGLLGSRWYTAHPARPLESASAMFNLDMIGRNDASVVSVVGDRRSAALDAAVQRVNAASLRMTINHDAGSGIERSDHYLFGRMGIPALSFFSGTHEDYHRPSDTPDKVVAEKLEKISRLVFLAAWDQANNPVVRDKRAGTGAGTPGGASTGGGR